MTQIRQIDSWNSCFYRCWFQRISTTTSAANGYGRIKIRLIFASLQSYENSQHSICSAS